MGLIRVFLGVEASTDKILTSLDRQQTMQESKEAFEVCKSLGISVQFNIMIFNPETTFESIQEDIAFMKQHIEYPFNFCRTEIYSGTPLEKRMIEEGRAKGDYLAREYNLHDPRVDLACSLAGQIFYKRCWGLSSLIERAIGMDHLSAILSHFYDGPDADLLCNKIASLQQDINWDTISLLERLINKCKRSVDSTCNDFEHTIGDITKQETKSGQSLLKLTEDLHRDINNVVFEMMGLRTDGKQSHPRGLPKHAAAAIVAISLGITLSCGSCEYAPGPIRAHEAGDDSLHEKSEMSVYKTDPNETKVKMNKMDSEH